MALATQNHILVNVFRGFDHHVVSSDEQALEEIYMFFERLRTASEAARCSGQRKQLTRELIIPQDVGDWFIPRGIPSRNRKWTYSGNEDAEKLEKHVVSLYEKGAPTFFQQIPSPECMRWFVSINAFIPEDRVPHPDNAADFWEQLRTGLSNTVARAMCAVGQNTYGKKQHLILVLDACGFSLSALRWKVSMRIVHEEICVKLETAKNLRVDLIAHMEAERSKCRQGWEECLEPQPNFWESILDVKAYLPSATHRLPFCDIRHPPYFEPEERPLVPAACCTGDFPESGELILTPVKPGSVQTHQYVLLGGAWARDTATPTPITCVRPAQFSVSLPQGSGEERELANAPTAANAASQRNNDWYAYLDENTGNYYYHNMALKETVWQLPPDARMLDPRQSQQPGASAQQASQAEQTAPAVKTSSSVQLSPAVQTSSTVQSPLAAQISPTVQASPAVQTSPTVQASPAVQTSPAAQAPQEQRWRKLPSANGPYYNLIGTEKVQWELPLGAIEE